MDLLSPPCCLAFNLQRAARALGRGLEEALRATGLTAPQFATLARLDAQGAMTAADLGEALGTDRTTLSRNLDLLVRRGDLAPAPAPDRRQRPLALTEAGRARLGAARPLWEGWQREQVGRLGEAGTRRLLDVVQSL